MFYYWKCFSGGSTSSNKQEFKHIDDTHNHYFIYSRCFSFCIMTFHFVKNNCYSNVIAPVKGQHVFQLLFSPDYTNDWSAIQN